jgi:hypothetical protein
VAAAGLDFTNPEDPGTIAWTEHKQAPASPVPVPAAVWLLGSGLIGMIGIRRRRNG